ncbi:MAG: AI-2E family transporter [Campylobacteraceae bacterium]|jgi:predicted PurR-regulated permease PerM|nr:AI-2E family transporter [Campylobacteraceae bacterium]
MNGNRLFLFGVLVLTLYAMFRLYLPFLMDITIASLLAVAMFNINLFIQKFVKYPFLSSILTTLLLFLLFFAPIGYAITALSDFMHFDENPIEKISALFASLSESLPESLKVYQKEYFDDFDKAAISANIVSYSAMIAKASAGFVKDMVLIAIFFFFAIYYGKNLVFYFQSVVPMRQEETNSILSEVGNVMSVVFYSILLTAILEGILFAVIGIAYGYNGLLLGILYGFASLIPFIGGALVWLPVSLIELSNGNTLSAVVIALYSFVGIGAADYFIKPLIIQYTNKKLLKTPVYFNALLIFFSIIAGLASFGFWGMILGPALTTFFISLLKLYRILKDKSGEETA